jgi:phosphoribosylformylglycinamidine synthase
LAVALAECGFKKGLGVTVEIASDNLLMALFGEGGSRVIVSCAAQGLPELLKQARDFKIPAQQVGTVGGPRLRIGEWVDVEIGYLKEGWTTGFLGIVGMD